MENEGQYWEGEENWTINFVGKIKWKTLETESTARKASPSPEGVLGGTKTSQQKWGQKFWRKFSSPQGPG